MRIRTLTASRMDEALRMIRNDLGPEALILSTRKVKQPNGEWGLEITAAINEPEPASQPVSTPSDTPQPTAAPLPLPANTLEAHGLPAYLIQKLNTATQGLASAGFTGADALDMVLGKLLPLQPFPALLPAGHAHVFLGPTGAGKTTWVSKLAVHAKRQGRTVGMLSLDDQKIAGFEPLAVTAETMGDTAHLLRNKADLRQAAASLGPRNLLLIDTPGLNPYNKQALAQFQQRLTDLGLPIRTHLVIPGHLNPAEMGKLPVAFHRFSPQSLIFTRLDEMAHYGPLITCGVESNLPLGLASNSADVTTPPLTLTSSFLAQILSTHPRQPWEMTP